MTSFSSTVDHLESSPAQHRLDQALDMQPQADGSLLGQAPAGYWNMVGPYGGITAAQVLQAVMRHPQRLGDPVSLTVNYAGAIAAGDLWLEAVPVRTNRSSQHWSVTLTQQNRAGDREVCTSATVVTAIRRSTFGIDDVNPPAMPDPELCERYSLPSSLEWLQRYDMRLVQGMVPKVWDDRMHDSLSQLWVRDEPPRPLDFPALASLCDVFYPRIWLRRARQVAASTVSMTVYFHADAAQLQRHGDLHVLAQASAQAFRNGFFDQTAQLWDQAGELLATSHQIVYYKE